MDSVGSIRELDTDKMNLARLSFESGIKEYISIKTNVELSTTELFLHWKGKGKTQFEKDYTTIYRQLTDIEDILYELYNALIDAESTYISVDQEISKKMTP